MAVSNSDEGESSNRSEQAAAVLALENSLTTDKNIVILTDSKCLMDSIQPWIGEGCNPMIHKFPDGDILRDVIELLRKRLKRVVRGLFTLSKFARTGVNSLMKWRIGGRIKEY